MYYGNNDFRDYLRQSKEEDYLCHWGVKGMKWGKHKAKIDYIANNEREINRLEKKNKELQAQMDHVKYEEGSYWNGDEKRAKIQEQIDANNKVIAELKEKTEKRKEEKKKQNTVKAAKLAGSLLKKSPLSTLVR